MFTVKVYELIPRKALVTRQSAGVIGTALAASLARDESELTIDFSGVEAITPSFIDGALWILQEKLPGGNSGAFRILFRNLPTRLSSKFAAVGRAHKLHIRETEVGCWTITPSGETRPVE